MTTSVPTQAPSESTRIPPIQPSNPPAHLASNQPFRDALAAALARRGAESGSGLLALDQALLHSPALTRGWSAFFSALRTGCAFGADVGELVMCRIAVLNRARFMWGQHRGLLRRAWVERVRAGAARVPGDAGEDSGGREGERMADGVLELLQKAPAHVFGSADGLESGEKEARQRWREDGMRLGMDEKAIAVLAYTDVMTRDVAVPDAIWDQLKNAYVDEGDRRDQLLVEITGIIAGYNCGSRFLVALDVGGMKDWE